MSNCFILNLKLQQFKTTHYINKHIIEQKEFVHAVLVKSSNKPQELQWSKINYFIINDASLEKGKLIFECLNSPIQGSGLDFHYIGNRYEEVQIKICPTGLAIYFKGYQT